jgi:hypothetical protein
MRNTTSNGLWNVGKMVMEDSKKHDLNCKNQKVIDSNDKSQNVHHPTFLLDKQHWLMAVNL